MAEPHENLGGTPEPVRRPLKALPTPRSNRSEKRREWILQGARHLTPEEIAALAPGSDVRALREYQLTEQLEPGRTILFGGLGMAAVQGELPGAEAP
jgi:hypothetical protein